MRNEPVSEGRMAELATRARRCCCKYCGGELEVRLIVFGKFEEAGAELYCTRCNRIEYGTEPEIYQDAKYFVEVMGFDAFPELDRDSLSDQRSVAKVCEIMMWHDVRLGILDEQGFSIAIKEGPQQIDHGDGSMIFPGEEISW